MQYYGHIFVGIFYDSMHLANSFPVLVCRISFFRRDYDDV